MTATIANAVKAREGVTTPAPSATTLPPIPTADVLSLIQGPFDQFVVFPSEEARDAVILWTAHTYAMRAWRATPRLAIMSAEKGCGKTRVLELLEQLTPNAELTINLTPSGLWQTLDMGNVTVLVDETDTTFGRKGSTNAHRALQAVLNLGYRPSGSILRSSGSGTTRRYRMYGPVALAGIGELPDTIADRSIIIPMHKRTEQERIKAFRLSENEAHLQAIRGTLEIWAQIALPALTDARPEMPVTDRLADVWEALLAIADLAGEDWPDRARDACRLLTARTEHRSIGTLLLSDIRDVFREDRMFTSELLAALYASRDGWTSDNLTGSKLAGLLSRYGITSSGTIRIGKRTLKGYHRAAFETAWAEYLPSHVTPKQAA